MTDETTRFAEIDVVAGKYLSAGKPLPGDNYLFDDLIEQVGGAWAEMPAAAAYPLLLKWRREHHAVTEQ